MPSCPAYNKIFERRGHSIVRFTAEARRLEIGLKFSGAVPKKNKESFNG
jgi:hypothetical protein